MVKALDLKIRNLKEILPLEGAAGIKVPYLGYVEARLEIPGVDAFNKDCLFLVMPDHEYGHRVPVTIGTLHIDMIIEQASKDELDQLGTAWGRGKVNRQIQARRVQLEYVTQLETITGKVWLTKKVKLKSNQSLKVKARSSNPLNIKRVNVIIEPTDDEEGNYTIPAYTYLKSNSRNVHVGLCNMSCHAVSLSKGTVVAELSPANAILKMLAPKLASCQLKFAKNQGLESNKLEFINSTNSQPKLTKERRDKIFSKLDLTSYDDWTQDQRDMMNAAIEHYHHIFAVEDLELGRTNWVKHEIKLTNYVPFKEQYRRIPPHQNEEVRKHLDEMLRMGVIRKSNSPWASVVVLVHKKDGALRLCIDLRKLNERTVKDAYSLPRIDAGLKLKPSKCEFFKKRIHYLGHIVSNKGIETDPKKIEAIVNWPGPHTVHEVRKFLGFTIYYRKFMYKYAQIAQPLNKPISGENAKKKHKKVELGK